MSWSDLRTPLGVVLAVWLALLQGCSTPPPSAPVAWPPKDVFDHTWDSEHVRVPGDSGPSASAARNAKAYRQDAAKHLYAQQPKRIYTGRLPPMLYAVGVLNVDIDHSGQVKAVNWMRAPKHAPEVMREIEQMVHAAAPFPAPQHLRQVTYTDVWLWHRSGRFQLDTLTEGQD